MERRVRALFNHVRKHVGGRGFALLFAVPLGVQLDVVAHCDMQREWRIICRVRERLREAIMAIASETEYSVAMLECLGVTVSRVEISHAWKKLHSHLLYAPDINVDGLSLPRNFQFTRRHLLEVFTYTAGNDNALWAYISGLQSPALQAWLYFVSIRAPCKRITDYEVALNSNVSLIILSYARRKFRARLHCASSPSLHPPRRISMKVLRDARHFNAWVQEELGIPFNISTNALRQRTNGAILRYPN